MAILPYDGKKDYGYKKQYHIYVLKHPDTLEIFYVGQTKLDLVYRLLGHISDAKNINKNTEKCIYIRDILSKNKRPIIESVEKIDTFSYLDRMEVAIIEYKWIKYYQKTCNLLNINGIKVELNLEYNSYLRARSSGSVGSQYYYCGSDGYGNKYYDQQRIESDGLSWSQFEEDKPLGAGYNFTVKQDVKEVNFKDDMFYNDIPLGW